MFSSRALFPNQNPENQVRAQPSASRGGPESDPPSRVSGRAASAWRRARSSSHHRSDWAELTISMGSRNTMSDRESSCRNTRRGPGPRFEHGFSLDPESTSQRAIADERSQAAVSVARMCHSRLLNSDPNNKKTSPVCAVCYSIWCTALGATQFASAPYGKMTQKLCVPQKGARCRSTFVEKNWTKYERR